MLREFDSFVISNELKALQGFLDRLLGWQGFNMSFEVLFKVTMDIVMPNTTLAINANWDTAIGGLKKIYPADTQDRNFCELCRYAKGGSIVVDWHSR